MPAPFEDAHDLAVGDVLNRLRGKHATLMLADGGSVTGIVADGPDYSSALTLMVRVEKIEGRELFDALITKSRVVGFMTRR